jgi:hypothetical protein
MYLWQNLRGELFGRRTLMRVLILILQEGDRRKTVRPVRSSSDLLRFALKTGRKSGRRAKICQKSLGRLAGKPSQ